MSEPIKLDELVQQLIGLQKKLENAEQKLAGIQQRAESIQQRAESIQRDQPIASALRAIAREMQEANDAAREKEKDEELRRWCYWSGNQPEYYFARSMGITRPERIRD